MIGISKERLIQIAYETHDSDDTNIAILSLLDMLINECQELAPWLPISENTPKDRYILIFDVVAKSKVVAKFDTAVGLYLDRGRVAVYATHYKELSEDPKNS
jgi:hypothetical protein